MLEISIAGPEDTNGIREVLYKSWLANTVNEEPGQYIGSATSRDEPLSKENKSKLKNDIQRSRKSSLPASETFVAKVNKKVIGFAR